MRPAIERFNTWLKTFRRAIIRYERPAVIFQPAVIFHREIPSFKSHFPA